MKYHFIEIGTCDFDTEIQKASDNIVGISVEPLKHYLDALPVKQHVKKINAAVSISNTAEDVEIFYISEDDIRKHGLPPHLKGCNCINDFHYQHIKENVTHLVKRYTIPSIPISQIFETNGVTEVDYLKLDIEGHDSKIIIYLCDYLSDKPKLLYPKKIRFEANMLAAKKDVDNAIEALTAIGYTIDELPSYHFNLPVWNPDIVATFKPTVQPKEGDA